VNSQASRDAEGGWFAASFFAPLRFCVKYFIGKERISRKGVKRK
jgi:hypothetical protein